MGNRVARGLVAVLAIGSAALCARIGVCQDSDTVYRLRPEDIIRIYIYNEAQVDSTTPVGEDGNVSAPFVGIIKAAGRTTAEIETELTRLYVDKLRLRDPKVAVVIIKYRELRATVGGAVNRPGTFPVRKGDTVITLLNYAGGTIIANGQEYRRAVLRRAKTQEQVPIDLNALIQRSDTSQNYEVQDGDELLVIEEERNAIQLMGAIQRPGRYSYRDGMRLDEIIAMGGGEIPQRTKLSQVLIIRQVPGTPERYLQLKADFVAFVRNKDFSQNVALRPGDIVYVSSTKTPLLQDVSAFVNTAFFADRVLKDGIFGIRPFGRF